MKTIAETVKELGATKLIEKLLVFEKHLTKKEMEVARMSVALAFTGDTSNSLLQEVSKDKPDISTVKNLIADLDEAEHKRMADKIKEIDRAFDDLSIDLDFDI